MTILDDARRLTTTDTSMTVSNPEWRKLVTGLVKVIDAAGIELCTRCGGTGAIDTPFSGSDPDCTECNGEGVKA